MSSSPSPLAGAVAEHPAQKPRYGYLTPKQAAAFTAISIQELERLRRVGGGPRFSVVSSRLVRYSIEVLCDWMEAATVNNTSEARERLEGHVDNPTPASDVNEKLAPVTSGGQRAETDNNQGELSNKPDPKASTDFLRKVFPASPWALVTFPAGTPATFGPEQTAECEAWIASQNATGNNVFYHVNHLKAGPPRKAKKEDIASVAYLHIDIDPAPGEDLARETTQTENAPSERF